MNGEVRIALKFAILKLSCEISEIDFFIFCGERKAKYVAKPIIRDMQARTTATVCQPCVSISMLTGLPHICPP